MKRVFTLIVLGLTLVGCGGGDGDGSAGLQPPVFDLTGRFTTANIGCVDNQGNTFALAPSTFTQTQSGNTLRVINEQSGTIANGTVSGDVVTVEREFTVAGVACRGETDCTVLSNNEAACTGDVMCDNGVNVTCTFQLNRL